MRRIQGLEDERAVGRTVRAVGNVQQQVAELGVWELGSTLTLNPDSLVSHPMQVQA